MPRPEPKTGDRARDLYVFERETTIPTEDGVRGGLMDLYKHGCFVLEAKQGSHKGDPKDGIGRRESQPWKMAMRRAFGQTTGYAHTLDPPPPFLLVCDIGYCLDLYFCFDRSRSYQPYSLGKGNRLYLRDLGRHRELLRQIFLDPHSLDRSCELAKVTRELAGRLASLAAELEATGHAPEEVARFLMRCLFTMVAEDLGLLPRQAFSERIEKAWIPDPDAFPEELEELWRAMNEGRRYGTLGRLLRFNGGLFAQSRALPLQRQQLTLLLEAARCDWAEVEPAIFGTLLERALDRDERQRLGAYYTPRAYVERLVRPTIEEPLRDDWDVVRAQVWQLHEAGKDDAARAAVRSFLDRLCRIRVLDPACGSGNFLYVALDLFKRIEAEALDLLRDLGDSQTLLKIHDISVTPRQFLGIEVKRWAKEIAELVLWIGWIQSHHRMWGGERPIEPVLRDYRNIDCRDAVLTWDGEREPATAEDGSPLTTWDGVTYRQSPVTGERVPDEEARLPVYRYRGARRAEWPEADFVISNPPFIGNARMRGALGHGYAEALRAAHGDVPESCDYVMYWWDQAARLLRQGAIRRFGFITTNSLTQTFNRKVLQAHLGGPEGLSILFAVPDHPWADSAGGADVRIAMTVAGQGEREGTLAEVVAERPGDGECAEVELALRSGIIHADLKVGANVAAARSLRAGEGLCCPGVKLHGAGFLVTPEQAVELGLGTIPGLHRHIRSYRNGRDVAGKPRDLMVIDLFGIEEDEVRRRFPAVYQWVQDRVKPERDAKAASGKDAAAYAAAWWVFGKPRPHLRAAISDLKRYISTVETSKHRYFVFHDAGILPDNMLVNIALDDAFYLGVLSSRVHVTWALAAGGRLGVGNDPRYTKSACFDKFPFPDCSEAQRDRIRQLGEELHGHRERQLRAHPALTLTTLYNVLDRLCAGAALTPRERTTHEQGLLSTLRRIHEELDAAVFDAYGWPRRMGEGALLERLVALNAERAAEEGAGRVRWLRPALQAPAAAGPSAQRPQARGADQAEEAAAPSPGKLPWPKRLPEQIAAVRAHLSRSRSSQSLAQLARAFSGARRAQLESALESLEVVGAAVAVRRAEERCWRGLRRAA